ncbi:TonB-dependent receptor family protein [Methylogaea oryzae]|uniref:Membrane protein n=2 Tax=Methylogaea oryzae TaxID=1295382 RepID=A0A8D5AK75_9GAMM|nr:TonB-dependent receptor [Methylogaea oryzae]BBL70816.1 membrane protein [Methylogaea oryzae]
MTSLTNNTLKRAVCHCLLAMGGSTLAAGTALAEHTPEHLEKIQVTDSLQDFSFTNPSAEQAKEKLSKVPGATTLIKAEDFNNRANTGGMADILARTPGVFSESRYGNQESRISIRGSGVTMTFGSAGIRYLRDGLPLINADGYGSPELIEPMTAQYMEVYRGANALQYGSATLGGAVNFVSKTGRNYNGYGVNMVFGSHDYYRPQVQAGGLINENLDYYATYTGSFTDGFREHSQEDIHRFFGNMGYRWDDRNETRVYFTAAQNRMQLPGTMRMTDQFDTYNVNGVNRRVFQHGWQTKPSQAFDSYKAYGDDRNRNFDLLRTDVKHTMLLGDDDRLDFGAWYENKRFDHHTPQNINSQYNNSGATFRYLQNDVVFGHANHLTIGGYFAWGDNDGEVHCPNTNYNCNTVAAARAAGVSRHIMQDRTFAESMTVEGYMEDRFELNDMFDVVAGAQGVFAKRRRYDDYLTAPAHDESAQKDYGGWSPKVGLIWKAVEKVEVYGNASRSYEPPNSSQFSPRTANPVGGKYYTTVDGQEATTVELGVRGEKGIFSWDVAAYHSWLRDELLTAPDFTDSTKNLTINAKDTTHSGIEAGAQALIPLGVLASDDKLRASVTYNYTRFLFKNDKTYGDNYIPSIPNHFGMGELLYEHPTGFYVGPNVKMANSYYADYSNTKQWKAPAFSLIGARAGYKDKAGWSVFIEGKNLTNENWVSNVAPTALASSSNQQLYNPGYDRQIFGGFSIDFH